MKPYVINPPVTNNGKERKFANRAIKKIKRNYELYLFILPPLLYFIIFHYYPMYGVIIAFKDFIGTKGILGSPWVGLEHFRRFFTSHYFIIVLKNTLGISLYSLVAGFPIPIILSLMLNETDNKAFKKLVQTVTYAPHFISTVVMVGIILIFLSPGSGMVNQFVKAIIGEPIYFMRNPAWFKTIYVLSGIWQEAGWGAIIYLAVLTNVDPQIHEAAVIDGASRFKRIIYINIPVLMPTIVILLILRSGSIMSVGFEKVFLMQNDLNLNSSEIISTFVYRRGLLKAEYSFASAVGLFNSVINSILLLLVNTFSRKYGETSLW